ncbi:chromosome segregation protein SMC [Clostridium sp. NSJ-6]|uniref:Chromosome partition protein Smc n=1 Tax=Clostridium hominis TaxID=2763036 RepID=A0ABR7DAR3_9CLOT|nr:chromosome segregation protein SMC [Clostridium hominis]MBC5628474.1 chromosome segregation protein SMC [Clostridium hominis]MDU2671058.1 chromosome segregation protein SMC [Clostridium sp.]
MFLKSLEVRGFKSFADKTELNFKKGITAVVGPNGSGKSNISDAVRWVLGEQSVKSLRGGKMEDVIFAGTQFRKPVGLAQVSLCLDNSDGSLPIEYNEVIVTRRIFRSGETEYLINKQKCRLKDIIELFMDTGIGKEGYSLIGQGKIDAILSGRPEERRALFEEAAGIVKYKARKDEAEKKLDNTENNLIRIRDIISTYEERLGPLKEEKEKAIKYKALAEELKVKEVSLIVFHLKKVKADLEVLRKDIEDRENTISLKRENILKYKSEIFSLEEAIEEIERKNKEERERYYSEKEAMAKNSKDIDLFKERISNFKNLIVKEEKDIEEINLKLNDLNNEKEALEKEIDSKLEERRQKELSIREIENNISENNREIIKIEAELNKLKDSEYEFLSKNSEIKNSIKSIEKDITNTVEQKEALVLSINNLKSNLTINIATIEKLRENIAKTKKDIKSLEENVIELKKDLSRAHSKLNQKENGLKILTKNINGLEATHSALSNLEKHYEGYNRTVKNLMEHILAGKVSNVSDIKVLGEIFNVDKQYEVAIEIALGAAISNVITKNDRDAKLLIQYLKSRSLGRATFLPLNIIKGKRLNLPENIKKIEGYIGIASDLITVDDIYKDIVDYNLGRTIISKDMDSALAISKVGNHNYKIVTLTGEVINPGGALTGGSIQGKSSNLLGRKREIEEIEVKVEKLRAEYSKENEILQGIKNDIKKIDEEIIDKREEVHQKNINLTVLDGETKNLVIEGEKIKKSLEYSNDDLKKKAIFIDNLTKQLELKKNELDSLGKKNYESKEKVKLLEETYEIKKRELDILKEKATEMKISRATLDESIQGKKNELYSKRSNIAEREQNIKNLLYEINEKKINIKTLEDGINNKTSIIEKINENIRTLEEIFKEDEVRKISYKEELKVKETFANEIIEEVRVLENELNKRTIQKVKLDSEEEGLFSKLNGEINLTLAEAMEIAIEIDNVLKIKEEIGRLKGKISAIGTVNLSAILEYDEVLEKYEFMSSQELDLEQAKNELLDVISEMTIKMQKMFRENFEILNENFGETFRELFKGGTAELILGEGDELNANIVINVQPPGKKLQNINLMSGGEKVLSAIALLFAILKMKPTPFCILDEIEAALDDANVFRYAEFLKQFSHNIQFVVITHRKGTMEVSDVMYGVTMEEKGISKVVSVDLTEN